MLQLTFNPGLVLTGFRTTRPDQRVKGIVRTSGEIDFRFRLKLKITLVESTYPSQRPECPSLSPHFLLFLLNKFCQSASLLNFKDKKILCDGVELNPACQHGSLQL